MAEKDLNAKTTEVPTKGTTETLFPEFFEEKTQVTDEKTAPSVPVTEVKTEKTEPKTEPQSEYLDVTSLAGKKVKVKIDGQELDVTPEDLLRGYQTAQSLTRKGQSLAAEREKLRLERVVLDQIKSELTTHKTEPSSAAPKTEEEDTFYETFIKPYVEPLTQKINALETSRGIPAEVNKVLGPVIYQNNLKEMDLRMKGEGLDDFMSYVPKIEAHLSALSDPEEVNRLDTPAGFEKLYKDMKLKAALTTKMEKPIGEGRVEPKIETPTPPKTEVEGSTGPSGVNNDNANYDAAFERAKESGDWTEVFRMKGIL